MNKTPVRRALVVALLLVGCTSVGGGTNIETRLADDSITLSSAEVPAGKVTFDITNTAGQAHEVEVFSGAIPGQRPPVVNHVADTKGLSVVGEKEDILGGTNVKLTLDLEPGTYLVICNLPDHYQRGMVAELTVTATPGT